LGDPIKIWGPKNPNLGQFSNLPVHCSGTDEGIANLKRIIKQEMYAQRAQTSADPDDPDFGLWTPGSKA